MSASSASIRELSDADYSRFRKSLLREKGSGRQRDFLGAVRASNDFLDRLSVIPTVGTNNVSLAPEQMTEEEYKNPPSDTEQALYLSWSNLTPSIACRSTFWAQLTLEHVRNGRIESVFLAANGSNLSGAERIDSVLRDTTARAPQQVDSCVRTVLRRLGGLPEVRGNRSVYVDCPFARAWWRERMVEEASNGDMHTALLVRSVIRIHQTYWEKLIDRIVFRNSTFGSREIRNSFVRALARFLHSNPKSSLKDTKNLQTLCRRATALQGSRELSILDDRELDTLMVRIVEAM